MWRILQHDTPDDFVLATGQTWTVKDFVERAFAEVDIEMIWEGEGVDEIGRDRRSGRVLVQVDPRYFRPTEVELLIGDPSKAERELGWKATTTFEKMVGEMVAEDLEAVADEVSRRRLDEDRGRSPLRAVGA
jgi:GDPmannose 4,6-dehydratase